MDWSDELAILTLESLGETRFSTGHSESRVRPMFVQSVDNTRDATQRFTVWRCFICRSFRSMMKVASEPTLEPTQSIPGRVCSEGCSRERNLGEEEEQRFCQLFWRWWWFWL